MATTRILKIKINKGQSVAATLSLRVNYPLNEEKTVNKKINIAQEKPITDIISDSTDYAQNPDKTSGGELVRSYECDPHTVDLEFLLSKKKYDYITGRDQGDKNTLAYHIRQSFKPGEIEPEHALEIGYELAMRYTKGAHAFIVATHTDKVHIHNHIVFNSTALSHDRKFNEPRRSAMIVRRISDLLCLENGLSIVENPKPSKGKNYAKWLGNKEPSYQDKLRQKIDEVLPSCATFENFLAAMKSAGYIVNDKHKHITLLAPGQKKPTRLNTLKGDHTEEAIRERIAGTRIITSAGGGRSNDEHSASGPVVISSGEIGGETRVSLLIDIQAKIQAGKGEGYERWARIFNLKEAAKTLLFLQENGIDSYEDLVKKSSSASGDFAALSNKIKEADTRIAEITELQKYIGQYSKTRDTYAKYKASGWDKDFYESQRADITLHRAAKKYFDGLGLKKLPTIAALKQEYATLQSEKKKLYNGYRAAKDNMRELVVAKDNATKILGLSVQSQEAQKTNIERKQQRSNSHDR